MEPALKEGGASETGREPAVGRPENASAGSSEQGPQRQTHTLERYRVQPDVPGRTSVQAPSPPELTVQAGAPAAPALLQSTVRLRYQTQASMPAAPDQRAAEVLLAPSLGAAALPGVSTDQFAKQPVLRYWSETTGPIQPEEVALAAAGGGAAPDLEGKTNNGPDFTWLGRGPLLRYQTAAGPDQEGAGVAPQAVAGGRAPNVSGGVGGPAVGAPSLGGIGFGGAQGSVPLPAKGGGAGGTAQASSNGASGPGTGTGPSGAGAGGSAGSGSSHGGEGGDLMARASRGPVGASSGRGSGIGAGVGNGAGSGAGSGGPGAGSGGVRFPPFVEALATQEATRLLDVPFRNPEWEYSERAREEVTSSSAVDRSWLLRSRRSFEPTPLSVLAVTPTVEILLNTKSKPVRIDVTGTGAARAAWLMWVLDDASDGVGAGKDGGSSARATAPPKALRPEIDLSQVGTDTRDTVLLAGVIRRSGQIEGLDVIRGAGSAADQSVISALGGWTFQPATRNGEPVDVGVVIAVKF